MIGSKGEYTGWRATRASGDFDLRTFEVRAYPTQPVDGLRPGMSVYTDWSAQAPVTPAPTGLFAVAAREVRWILRDPVARFLLFGVPVIAFAAARPHVQPRGRPRARYRRRRHGQLRDVAAVRADPRGRARDHRSQTRADDLGAAASGDPRRPRHRRDLPAAGVRQGCAGRAARRARSRSSTPSSSRREATREEASATRWRLPAPRWRPRARRVGDHAEPGPGLVPEEYVLANPALNYAQFLLRAVLPTVLHVVIAISAGLAVGSEFRRRSMRAWWDISGHSIAHRIGRQAAAVLRRADADVRADGRHPRRVARRQLPRQMPC